MCKAYYNEYDKNAAAWLRELIKNGLIADGIVDERSIIDVQADDLAGFTQHHFFAGIGGWSLALRMASYSDDAPVWTASLPCQPFSIAGLGKGKDDERHLLPHFLELVRQCQPDRIFGEQVEGAIRHGWLDDLQTTMEKENYAVGHCVLGAHSVSAPHIRQRLYWVADNSRQGFQEQPCGPGFLCNEDSRVTRENIKRSGELCGVANHTDDGLNGSERATEQARGGSFEAGRRVGDADSHGREARSKTTTTTRHGDSVKSTSWNDPDWLYCRDNKYRPIKPGLKPLVDGVPRGMVYGSDPNETQEARVMRLKGYGNAIVPQVAAEFISAFMDIA